MRYKISVQHKSEHNLDGQWYLLSECHSAETAIFEYLKFSEAYGRPVKIEDDKFLSLKQDSLEGNMGA